MRNAEYGYVVRELKSRHIQFIALGGTIGTGLFVGIGGALATSGPLSVLLGYSITGMAIFAMMQCLGEMATWLPLPGAIPQYCTRYVDPAMGFAVGWNNWNSSSLTLCSEISAATLVITYWDPNTKHEPIYVASIVILITCLNIFAVSIYGEAEFVFASVKIITIVALLLLALIVDLGGALTHDRLGFCYWREPYAAMLPLVARADTGRFLGLFKTLTNAAFAYGGVDMIAVAAGEAKNPQKNIPKAVHRVFWRILFFYVLGALAIGVCVPANDDHLLHGKGTTASPWVISVQRAGIPLLPHIINAVILTSASSSWNEFLYTGSRYLFALAQNRQAPSFLLKCSEQGVPWVCVLITASISLLTFMTVSKGSANVFGWFQTLTTITSLLTWSSILIAFLRFRAAIKAQGVSLETDLVFRSKWQPYTAYGALKFFVIILLFNGWMVFIQNHWSARDLVTA